MKKSILIVAVVLATFGLTAFSLKNWNNPKTTEVQPTCQKAEIQNPKFQIPEFNINPTAFKKKETDFFYAYGSRFEGFKKSDLNNAKSVHDFLPKMGCRPARDYNSVGVIIIINDEQSEIREFGNDENLTTSQLDLLQNADYSTNFLIRAEYLEENHETGLMVDNYTTPHYTIVPEKQAQYTKGNEALLDYIRKENYENTLNLDESKLQPAKLYFTVTKYGIISNIRVDRTSGYKKIDDRMLELIKKAPGKWIPAENTEGEKVDQELVISYGMVGC